MSFLMLLLNLLKSSKFKTYYLLILFGLVIYYLLAKRENLYNIINTARIDKLVWAFLFYWILIFIYVWSNYLIYRAISVPISYLQTFRIVSLSLLAKYVPGKIWVVGNYYLFSREVGVSKEDITYSFIVATGIVILSGFLCGLPLIFTLSASIRYLIGIIPIVIVIFLHPRVLNWVLANLLQIIQKLLNEDNQISTHKMKEINCYSYFKILGLISLNYVWTGIVFYFVLSAFTSVSILNLHIYVGAIALSGVLGMLAIFAPGGIGIRECVGTVILTQVTNAETAFLSMITLRIISAIVEFISALIASFVLKSKAGVPMVDK